VQVDGSKEVKKLDSMLRELREVLVNHLEGALEDIFHNDRDLVLHQRL